MSKRSINELDIILLSNDFDMFIAWKHEFDGVKNVQVVNSDFCWFMSSHKVDCVVSPANGYGLMDGAYDLAITQWFGDGLQKKVQRYIIDNLYGEQPVASSIVIDTEKDGIKPVHTPSMQAPSEICDHTVVYHCTRSCLMAALDCGANRVVVPAFGGCTGGLPVEIIANNMKKAYDQLKNPPDALDGEYVRANRLQ